MTFTESKPKSYYAGIQIASILFGYIFYHFLGWPGLVVYIYAAANAEAEAWRREK